VDRLYNYDGIIREKIFKSEKLKLREYIINLDKFYDTKEKQKWRINVESGSQLKG